LRDGLGQLLLEGGGHAGEFQSVQAF
jgi:hypothetical protein